jgi:hypothetical protein
VFEISGVVVFLLDTAGSPNMTSSRVLCDTNRSQTRMMIPVSSHYLRTSCTVLERDFLFL